MLISQMAGKKALVGFWVNLAALSLMAVLALGLNAAAFSQVAYADLQTASKVTTCAANTHKAKKAGWYRGGYSLLGKVSRSGSTLSLTGYNGRDCFVIYSKKLDGAGGSWLAAKKVQFKLASKTKVVTKNEATGKKTEKKLSRADLTKLLKKGNYMGYDIKVKSKKVSEVRLSTM